MDEYVGYYGRRKIYTDESRITRKNVFTVLQKALSVHNLNRGEIEYLYKYYKGEQPVVHRTKDVRPEIKNIVVENRANEIVSFKVGYLMGEPVQYVSRGENEDLVQKLTTLNEYMRAEDKAAKDKELADWSHICGTSYRMCLPDKEADVENDETPFEIYTLDPRNTFVVYRNDLGEKPVMCVKYVTRSDGTVVYSVYTEDRYFDITEIGNIIREDFHNLGMLPIIEYPANEARLGAFEIVLPLLDAINTVDSNRLDGVEQFVQALMLFHNVELDEKDFDKLRDKGAIKYHDVDASMKGEIKYLVEELNQSQSQTLVDHLYDTVLTICGIPNRNGGSSTSDTGSAVVMRDGWSNAEARAKDSELTFKKSEKEFLKLVLRICRDLSPLDLKMSSVEIRFTRRNYENISEKANVLVTMLNNDKIAPILGYRYCNMFADPDAAWAISAKYAEERRASELSEMERLAGVKDDEDGNEDPEDEL